MLSRAEYLILLELRFVNLLLSISICRAFGFQQFRLVPLLHVNHIKIILCFFVDEAALWQEPKISCKFSIHEIWIIKQWFFKINETSALSPIWNSLTFAFLFLYFSVRAAAFLRFSETFWWINFVIAACIWNLSSIVFALLTISLECGCPRRTWNGVNPVEECTVVLYA